MSLDVGDRLVCGFGWSFIQTCIPDGHQHTVTYPDVVLIQLILLISAQGCSKHVENWNKHMRKRIEHQVGYLQELYRDARSAKQNSLPTIFNI
jgi:hypothetical protein